MANYQKTDLAALLAESQARCLEHIRLHGDGTDDDSVRLCFEHGLHADGVNFPGGSLTSSATPLSSGVLDQIGKEDDDDVRSPSDPQQQSSRRNIFSYRHHLQKVQAPMVRCSRPPFRRLCRLWGTDISYTHMILADCFDKAEEARQSDFALFQGESRLVTQFAAKCGPTLARAAAYVAPYCDAIDINCGCPQRWAMKDGYGSALLEHPELVADMVSCVTNAGPTNGLPPCVVKIRVYDDLQKTVEFARRAEKAGAAWITVHGRTPKCTPSSRVRHEAIRLVRESVAVPVVANGAVVDPPSAIRLALNAGVAGVMSAQGLLDNPACFDGPTSMYAQMLARGWQRLPPPRRAVDMMGRNEGKRSRSDSAILSSDQHTNNGDDSAALGTSVTAEDDEPVACDTEEDTTTNSRGGRRGCEGSFWELCHHALLHPHNTYAMDRSLSIFSSCSSAPRDTMLLSSPSSSPTLPVDTLLLSSGGSDPIGCAPGPLVAPLAAISDFCRLALACQLPLKATQHHLLMMCHRLLSPTERAYVAEMQSSVAIVSYLQSIGIFVPASCGGRFSLP